MSFNKKQLKVFKITKFNKDYAIRCYKIIQQYVIKSNEQNDINKVI